MILKIALVVSGILAIAACTSHKEITTDDAASAAPLRPEVHIERLTENGGRLAWYKGTSHELIAFDAKSDLLTGKTELYTMQPDGSEITCITCDAPIPKGFVGQPSWHPDGDHIVLQVENRFSRHRLFNHMAWGIDNDLWLIKRDGTGAERIYATPRGEAVLHPHFSADGSKLIFAERVPTGRVYRQLVGITPGGENHWDGWRIHIADFNIHAHGTAKLTNHRILFKEISGFFETHGFTKDGKIIYSFTARGKPYVDDIYVCDIEGRGIRNLINSTQTWDEHGLMSPSGRTLAFNSSRGDASWAAPHSKAADLTLDLFIKTQDGRIKRLTDMNAYLASEGKVKYLTSDFDWDKTGTRIAFQVAVLARKPGVPPVGPEIWLLTFPNPQ